MEDLPETVEETCSRWERAGKDIYAARNDHVILIANEDASRDQLVEAHFAIIKALGMAPEKLRPNTNIQD